MSNIGYATLQVIPSLKGAGDALTKGILPAADSTGTKAGQSLGNKMKGGMLGSLKGIAGPIAAAFAGVQVVSFLKDSIGEAREAEKVGKITAQTIKATGGAAKVSADQVAALAGAISNKTGIDDEAIQSGANLLLTFKNVRNEVGAGANIFDRATQAATDLSAAGFGDLSGTSKQLGKALNDPLKGISALGKAGVTFTAEQQKMIKGMVAAGDLLGAQKIILGEVEAQVGGVAAASSTAGEKAAVAFGNFKETVGTALLPVIDKLANIFTTKIAPAITSFVTGLQDGTGAGGRFAAIAKKVGTVVTTAFEGFKTRVLPVLIQFGKFVAANVVPAIQGLYKAIAPLVVTIVGLAISIGSKVLPVVFALAKAIGGGLITAFGAVGKFIGDNATLFQSLAVGIGAALIVWKAWQLALTVGSLLMKGVAIATKAFAAVQAALNVVLSLNPIGLVVIALVALAAGLVYAYKHSETFRNIVNGVFGAVKDFVIGAVTAIRDFVVSAWNNIKAATSATWNGIKAAVSFVVTAVVAYVTGLKNSVILIWNAIKAASSAVWNGIKTAITAAIGFVVSNVTSRVNAVKAVMSAAWNALSSITSKAWNGIKTAVSTAISGVTSLVSGIKGKVTSALGNLSGLLVEAGKDLVRGLLNGISSLASQVADKAKELANAAKNAITGALGIHSPSRVAFGLGEFFGQGLANGIASMADTVGKAGGLLAEAAMPDLATLNPKVALSTTGLAGSAHLDPRTPTATASAATTAANQRPITVTVAADDPNAQARKIGRFLANTGV